MTEQDSPLWNFSLAVYGASGVEDECLHLQNRFGVDVNVLLLCAFLGAVHGIALSAGDIASVRAEVGLWHDDIVKSLRFVRRKLKIMALNRAETDSALQLRNNVKAIELESERIEQMMLERWANARLSAWPRGNPRDAVASNLRMLLDSYGATHDPVAARRLIAASLARGKRET